MFSVQFFYAECVKCGRKSHNFVGRALLPKECACGCDMLAVHESACQSGSTTARAIRSDFEHVLSAPCAGHES